MFSNIENRMKIVILFLAFLMVSTLNSQNRKVKDEFPYEFALQKRIGKYRVLYPPKYNPKLKYHLVMLLHGNSQEPIVFLRWAKQLNISDAIFICPEGTYTQVAETLKRGVHRFSAAGEDLQAPDSLKSIIVYYSAEWYNNVLMDARKKLNVHRFNPCVVIGFSQGGFYASVLASRYPENYSSVVSICGSLYQEGRLEENISNFKRFGIEVLLLHGNQDNVVPIQTSQLYKSILDKYGVTNQIYSFEGGHWPSNEATQKISEWVVTHIQR